MLYKVCLYAVIIFFVITSVSFADPFTTQDKILEATYLSLHVIDWGQSQHIARNPDRFNEINPILGSHPTAGSVNTYMLVSGLLHPAISYVLPQPYRKWFQYGTLGIKAGLVGNNIAIGAGLRLPF